MSSSGIRFVKAGAICLIAFVAAGLRLQQLSIQWLMDDEWHALHKLLDGAGYVEIASSFGMADYCIPLTLLYRLLLDTVGLSEWLMRLPSVLAGLAFVALAMAWAWRRVPATATLAFGLLLALSPMLVNYSRVARPYMLGLLLAALALLALQRYAQTRRIGLAAAYLTTAWLAGYLHALLAPFVLAPLGWLMLQSLWRGGLRDSRPLIALAALTLAALLASILPPLLADSAAITAKAGKSLPTLATLWGLLHAWLGTASPAVALLGLALAGLGCIGLGERLGTLPLLWGIGLLAIALAVLVLQPASIQHPLTLARYLLPGLPALLLLVALGIAGLAGRLPRPASFVAVTALLAATSVGQPHGELLRRPNNFSLHSYHQFDYRPEHNLARSVLGPQVRPSPFWTRLAELPPGSQRVAITGNPGFESAFNLQPFLQPQHRQVLLNLQTGSVCGPRRHGEATRAQGVRLRNAVDAEVQALNQARVDWVVFDRGADRRLREAIAMQPDPPYIDACIATMEAALGPPDHVDDELVAFRLQPGALP